MKRLILLLFTCICVQAGAQNLQLRGTIPYGNMSLANIGSFADTAGNEYALVGTEDGLDIVDVTDPDVPVIRFSVPGASSTWREVKTYRRHAYVTTEGGGGLTVVDMTLLPDTVFYKQYTGDGAIANDLNSIHALHCDTTKGFLYLYGSNINEGNTLFLDLEDPWNPTYVGEYVYPGGGQDAYVHDGYADNDTLYESHIYAGFFAIVDVTDKSNPVLLGTQMTPTQFTHNTWLSMDHKTLFTTDENASSFLGAYDISDPANIQELSRYQTSPGSGVVVHNTHILNDFAVTSWYKDGVVIVDVARPANPIEVGKYDTYPQGSGSGFSGCWGVDPFLPSGTVVASDINNGLFVFTPTYIRGCYLEGIVTDSITNGLLNNALVEILSTTISRNTDPSGIYRTGTATAGTYDVRVSKPGYVTKVITGVSLTNGVLTQLDVQLQPVPTYTFTGTVLDSLTGNPVANAMVVLSNTDFEFTTTADAAGNFSLSNVLEDTYDFVAGAWGYRTECQSVTLAQGNQLSAVLAQGYYDDFSFDFGWTVSGTTSNSWERGVPVGTFDQSATLINPDEDATGDCLDLCYVTDNGGAPYNNHDVDNGFTLLTSPVFDATIYANPSVEYSRYYLCIDGVGAPNDTMFVMLSNGSTSVQLEAVPPSATGNGSWVHRSFQIAPLLTPTATMQLTVRVADEAPGNIVEGGFDLFEITGQLLTSVNAPVQTAAFSVFPNPFNNTLSIRLNPGTYTGHAEVNIMDASGRIIRKIELRNSDAVTEIPVDLAAGVYFVQLLREGQQPEIVRAVKQ